MDLSTDKVIFAFPNNEFPFELDGDNLVGYDFAVNHPKYQIEHTHDRQSLHTNINPNHGIYM